MDPALGRRRRARRNGDIVETSCRAQCRWASEPRALNGALTSHAYCRVNDADSPNVRHGSFDAQCSMRESAGAETIAGCLRQQTRRSLLSDCSRYTGRCDARQMRRPVAMPIACAAGLEGAHDESFFLEHFSWAMWHLHHESFFGMNFWFDGVETSQALTAQLVSCCSCVWQAQAAHQSMRVRVRRLHLRVHHRDECEDHH